MPYDDVQKFSEAAVNKAKLLKEQPGKYFLRSVMAGFFIVVAMIFSNVVGNVFQGSDPAWGKLLGGIVFAIAVLLIVFIGAELFTGNNLVMAPSIKKYRGRRLEKYGSSATSEISSDV